MLLVNIQPIGTAELIGRNYTIQVTILFVCFLFSCFIGETGVFFGAFLGPIFAILGFNCLAFVVVTVVILKHVRKQAASSDECSAKTAFRLVLNLAGIMACFGLAWLFGGLTISDGSIAFQFLFVIFNAFQGFYLFLFLVVLSKDAREQWMSVLRRKKPLLPGTDSSLRTVQRQRHGTATGTSNTRSTAVSSSSGFHSTSTLRRSSEDYQAHSTMRQSTVSEAAQSHGTLGNVEVTHKLVTVEEGEVEGKEVNNMEVQLSRSSHSGTSSQHQRSDMSPRFSGRGSRRSVSASRRGSERDAEVISNPSNHEEAHTLDCGEVGSVNGGDDCDSEVVSNQMADVSGHDSDCVDISESWNP